MATSTYSQDVPKLNSPTNATLSLMREKELR